MRIETILAALVVLANLSGQAQADFKGRSVPPHFSAAETRTIGRNELLLAIIERDPWLVRRILDLVAQHSQNSGQNAFASALKGIDPLKNPDLAGDARTADSSVEWIELLRRARAEKETIDKQPQSGMTRRSAQGSIEFFEMLQRAKNAKGGGTKN